MKRIPLDPKSEVSLFQQIVDGFEVLILTKQLKEGEFLPSVRDFAINHTINPNTVAKSYKVLQDMGLVENIRGLGLRIKKVTDSTANKRTKELLLERARELVSLAKTLQVPMPELIRLLEKLTKEEA